MSAAALGAGGQGSQRAAPASDQLQMFAEETRARDKVTARAVVEVLDVAAIDLAPEVWPRQRLNEQRVRQFTAMVKDNSQTLPPIEIISDGKRLVLADGHHRVAAFQRAGIPQIQAVVRPTPQGQSAAATAVEAAVASSATAALPLTPAGRRRACDLLHLHFPDMPFSEIGRRVGMSREGVSRHIHRSATVGATAAPAQDRDAVAQLTRQIVLALRRLEQVPDPSLVGGVARAVAAVGVGPDALRRWVGLFAQAHRELTAAEGYQQPLDDRNSPPPEGAPCAELKPQ